MKVIAATATGRRTPSGWMVSATPCWVQAATSTEVVADAVTCDQPRAAGAFGKARVGDTRRVDVDRVVAGKIRRRDFSAGFGKELPTHGGIIVQHAKRFAAERRCAGGVQQVTG